MVYSFQRFGVDAGGSKRSPSLPITEYRGLSMIRVYVCGCSVSILSRVALFVAVRAVPSPRLFDPCVFHPLKQAELVVQNLGERSHVFYFQRVQIPILKVLHIRHDLLHFILIHRATSLLIKCRSITSRTSSFTVFHSSKILQARCLYTLSQPWLLR